MHAQMDDFSNMESEGKEEVLHADRDQTERCQDPGGWIMEFHAFSCVRQAESVSGVRGRGQGGAGGRRLEVVLGRGSDVLTQYLL
jgi:hypothetical protein